MITNTELIAYAVESDLRNDPLVVDLVAALEAAEAELTRRDSVKRGWALTEAQQAGLVAAMTTLREQENHYPADSIASTIELLDYLGGADDNSALVEEIRSGDFEDRGWMIDALGRAADAMDARQLLPSDAEAAYEITQEMLADLLGAVGVTAAPHGLLIRKTAGAIVSKVVLAAAPVSLEAAKAETTTEWTETTEYAYGSLEPPVLICPTGEDIDDRGTAECNAEEFWLKVLERTVRRSEWRPVSTEGDTK